MIRQVNSSQIQVLNDAFLEQGRACWCYIDDEAKSSPNGILYIATVGKRDSLEFQCTGFFESEDIAAAWLNLVLNGLVPKSFITGIANILITKAVPEKNPRDPTVRHVLPVI